MTQITNGRLAYTRRINTGLYEHREVVADFSFAVAEGASAAAIDAFINQTGNLARTKVEQLAKGEALPEQARTAGQVVQPVVGQSDALKRGPGRPPKPPVTDVQPAETISPAAITPASSDDLDGPPVKSVGKIEDDLGDVTGAQAHIDDKTLVDHITHTNQRIKNAQAIRALIAEFVGSSPPVAAKIPQERRQEFINKLEGLK